MRSRAAGVAAVALLSACTGGSRHEPDPDTPAGAALSALVVAKEAAAADYRRTAFGPAWTDTDRNGCDTRNDVLRRDLTGVVLKADSHGCAVLSGVLHDPYTGTSVAFDRAHARVQVDHVVALAEAWRSGASTWPYARLLAFANDPLELLVVSSAVNQAKGDSDAADWLPDKGTCAFAARQVAVKRKYSLSVDSDERGALAKVLNSCPDQVLPAGGTPTLAPNRSPAP